MAVMNKQQAKKLAEMNDFFLDLLNLLKEKKVISNQEHRIFLLTGYEKLVEHLGKEKNYLLDRCQKSNEEWVYFSGKLIV